MSDQDLNIRAALVLGWTQKEFTGMDYFEIPKEFWGITQRGSLDFKGLQFTTSYDWAWLLVDAVLERAIAIPRYDMNGCTLIDACDTPAQITQAAVSVLEDEDGS